MDACPYCGEALTDARARHCPRCEAVLDTGDASGSGDDLDLVELDDDELEADGFDAVAARGKAPAKAAAKASPCPHCTKPVKPNQHRCPSCGKVVRELVSDDVWEAQTAYKRRLQLSAAGAVVSLLLLIGLVAWCKAPGATAPTKKVFLQVPLRELAGYYSPESRFTSEQQARMWERSHKGRFLAVAGEVSSLSAGGLFSEPSIEVLGDAGSGSTVRIRARLGKGEAEKTDVGQRVRIEGQLASYGGDPLFQLDHGAVLEVLRR